ncbi:hypothetical protein MIV074L [Invertebrate iridescent virus 3]|uniref:Uncharacterized protein 074L n=1 Tax=Invertebrate iridescent virus 3 TaxID=345201 RepID=VF268_IIV3|nr:hypothetical protein MIV074L [Invertebrate iridescent virus 3]Q196Y6.1 RecName: Full=Uncharacterized protein 074L [Invertebrate iridescent virus 3]ABF82104.1 hypothetical protein MIV074L [Invertebrate iridescent virus 3]
MGSLDYSSKNNSSLGSISSDDESIVLDNENNGAPKAQPRTTLLQLKKSLEADYKKNLYKNADGQDHLLLQNTFRKILNYGTITLDAVKKELTTYIQDSENEPYSAVVRSLLVKVVESKTIPVDRLVDFMTAFNGQSLPIDIFYKKYFGPDALKPTVWDVFGSSLSDLSSSDSDSSSTTTTTSDTSIWSDSSSASAQRNRSPTRSTRSSRSSRSSIRSSSSTSSRSSRSSSSSSSSSNSSSDTTSSSSSSSSSSEDDDESKAPAMVQSPTNNKIREFTPQERQRIELVKERAENKKIVPREAKVVQVQPGGKPGGVDVNFATRQSSGGPSPVKRTFSDPVSSTSQKDCEFLYKKLPWVKDIINHVYVYPVRGNFEGIIEYDKFIEHDGRKWYHPKEQYYTLQCMGTKSQRGKTLTITRDGKTWKLMVAIDTGTRGIVVQNEDMLTAELDYIRTWKTSKNDHIRDFMENVPTADMVQLAKIVLVNALQDSLGATVPLVYKSTTSPFIETVVDTIFKNSKNGESFVRILSNLVVFLTINLSFISSSVFAKRLRRQIYLPETLPFLTDADKLPEVFVVKNIPENTKKFVVEKLEEERTSFTRQFYDNLRIDSSLIRKPTKPILWNKPTTQVELPDIKTVCKNRNDVQDEQDEDVVYYTDMNEIYCFNVYKLWSLFRQTDTPINPYTSRPFTDQFIQIFLTRYASKPLVRKIENLTKTTATSRLEELIERELSLIENNLIEAENPTFIQKYKTTITQTPSDDYLPVQGKRRISRVTPSPPGGATKVRENFHPPGSAAGNTCMECRTPIEPSSDGIMSVFRNKMVRFCSYDCLERNKAFK